MFRNILLTVSIFLVITCQTAYSENQEEFRKNVPAKNVKTLEIHNINGNIDISSWNKDYIEIYAIKKTKKDRDELDKVKIDVNVGTNLIIETLVSQEGKHGFWGKIMSGANSPKVSVDYKITLPYAVSLENAENVNGDINVSNIAGNPELSTVNGGIIAESVRNGFHGQSTNGNIVAKGNNGGIDAKTTNGSIEISLSSGTVAAKTVNGSIEVTFLNITTSDIDLETVNGSIDMKIPENMSADIDIKTLNGTIRANSIPVTLDKISAKHFTGKIGKGGNLLNARTVNGDISLSK
jgi:DUF4097 and DUF4098 domain-containing protein YvlB